MLAMANLYETLGVPRTASSLEISAALRALVRRYHEESARGERDPTQALHVVNQARLTFADPTRKRVYDHALAAGEKVPSASEPSDAKPVTAAKTYKPPATAAKSPEPEPSIKAQRTFREEHLTLPAVELLPPIFADSAAFPVLKPAIAGATAAPPSWFGANVTLGSLLAPRSAAKQRSTAPAPWPRLAARLVDYALWALLLSVALPVAVAKGLISQAIIGLLDHPLVAPPLLSLSWVPIEAALLALFTVTPGKFLFDIHVSFNVTNPYASDNVLSRLPAALVRAFRVWWSGMACGVTPLYFFTMTSARRMLARVKETSWDFDGDCLVSHGKIFALVPALAAAALGTVAWGAVVHWTVPTRQLLESGWGVAVLSAEAVTRALEPLRPKVAVLAAPLPPQPTADPSIPLLRETKTQELTSAADWKGLSAHCKAWTQMDERSASAWLCLGRANYELGNHPAAVTELKRAAVLAPSSEEVRHLLLRSSEADMQQKQLRGRPNAARSLPRAAPPSQPDNEILDQPAGPQGKAAQEKP
jgi:uncharacterized RDD family membrane protein YckC